MAFESGAPGMVEMILDYGFDIYGMKYKRKTLFGSGHRTWISRNFRLHDEETRRLLALQ